MKILEISMYKPGNKGGVERSVYLLTKFLQCRGIEVVNVFQCTSSSHNSNLSYRCLRNLIPTRLKYLYPLRKLIFNFQVFFYVAIHKSDFDVVHINGDNGGLVTFIRNLKTIMTWRGNSYFASKVEKSTLIRISYLVSQFLEMVASRRSTRMVTEENNSIVVNFEKQMSKKSDITIIPIGIDTNLFRPVQNRQALKEELGLPNHKLIALWVGRDPIRKGLDIAINSLEKADNFVLLVAGISTDRKNERIISMGDVPDELLVKLYQISDVLLATSRYDASPFLTLLEAMSCGCVPIMLNRLSNYFLLRGHNCFLANEDNDFLEILKLIEHDPSILPSMSYRARETSMNFSYERVNEGYLKLLYDLNSIH